MFLTRVGISVCSENGVNGTSYIRFEEYFNFKQYSINNGVGGRYYIDVIRNLTFFLYSLSVSKSLLYIRGTQRNLNQGRATHCTYYLEGNRKRLKMKLKYFSKRL